MKNYKRELKSMNNIESLSPAFRYVGGKKWLSKELNKLIIKKIEGSTNMIKGYVEPFVGAGGAFFSNAKLLSDYNIKDIILNDISTPIFSFYKFVKNDLDLLIKEYLLLENKFLTYLPTDYDLIKKQKDEFKIKMADCYSFYSECKKVFNVEKNQVSIKNAALLIFMQNHCFNGIYRENKKGEYNSSFNWERRDYSKNISNIFLMHECFNFFNITISNESFENVNFKDDFIIYADPPYINNNNMNENNYNKDFFGIDKMRNLIDIISKGNFIFSHYHNSEIISFFGDKNINIDIHYRKNLISGFSKTRGDIKTEMVVYNL